MSAKAVLVAELAARLATEPSLLICRAEADSQVVWVVRPDGKARGYDYAGPDDESRAELSADKCFWETTLDNIPFTDLTCVVPWDPELLEMVQCMDDSVLDWLAMK